MKVEGNILTIKVDLTKDFGPSSSGKTIIIASTEGNIVGLELGDRGEDLDKRAKCILAYLSMPAPRSWWEGALKTGNIAESYIHILQDLRGELLAIPGLPERLDLGLLVALGFVDGVIIKGGDFRIAKQSEISLEGKDVIVIQTKASRLGMYLMGQAFFSAQLIKRFNPRSVMSVALCNRDDSELRPLFEQYPNMKVVVYPEIKMT